MLGQCALLQLHLDAIVQPGQCFKRLEELLYGPGRVGLLGIFFIYRYILDDASVDLLRDMFMASAHLLDVLFLTLLVIVMKGLAIVAEGFLSDVKVPGGNRFVLVDHFNESEKLNFLKLDQFRRVLLLVVDEALANQLVK